MGVELKTNSAGMPVGLVPAPKLQIAMTGFVTGVLKVIVSVPVPAPPVSWIAPYADGGADDTMPPTQVLVGVQDG